MFSGLSSWEFTTAYWYEDDYYSINPNINIGIGIETTDISLIDNAFLSFRLEASYGKAKTKQVFLANSKADFQVKSTPILFWTKLKSSGKISPYIKIGIGAEKSEFIESYYSKPELGFKVKEWFFCYGMGAGIDLNYFERLSLAIFVDTIIKENGFIIELSPPRERILNIDFRNSVFFCGLEFSYSF